MNLHLLFMCFIVALCLTGCGDTPPSVVKVNGNVYSLKGNAYVIKGNGDIKKAAGRMVSLVSGDSIESLYYQAIEKAKKSSINSTCERDKKQIIRLRNVFAENKKKTMILDVASKEVDRCLNGEANMPHLKQALTSLKAINDYYTPMPPSSSDILAAAVNHYNLLLAGDNAITVKISIDGSFKFNQVPEGNYIISSSYSDSFVSGYWLLPISINKDEQIELNNDQFKENTLGHGIESEIRSTMINIYSINF